MPVNAARPDVAFDPRAMVTGDDGSRADSRSPTGIYISGKVNYPTGQPDTPPPDPPPSVRLQPRALFTGDDASEPSYPQTLVPQRDWPVDPTTLRPDPNAPPPPPSMNPMNIMGQTGKAGSAFAASMLDRPGDVASAGRAAYSAGADLLPPPEGTPSPLQAAQERRGVQLNPWEQLMVDTAVDPGNFMGGEGAAMDTGKLAVHGVEAASVAGPAIIKLVKNLAENAPEHWEALKTAVNTLWPKLDAYGKPAAFLSGRTMLKRIQAAAGLSPEVADTLTQAANTLAETKERISPQEMQSLAQGQEYTPDRVVRKIAVIPEGREQIVGAPLGVSTPRQEAALRERYMKRMELGAAARKWYEDAGKSILFHANDDPLRANLFSEDLAITSPQTEVSGNTGVGIKAYNQANAGLRPYAGRFPTNMGRSVEQTHLLGAGGNLGQKRTPFAQNIAGGGNFLLATDPPRAVHDIWDGEAHGFLNPDGSPMRQGFGPAQHRWMDAQQDKIIAAANQRGLGGFNDWDHLSSQAAAWVGSKIEAGEATPENAGRHYADFFARHYAQGSRETVPGSSLLHMPELLQDTPYAAKLRQIWHELVLGQSGILDEKMRDQIAAGYGGLVGRSFQGPGVFEGAITPGFQTQVLTGTEDVPGVPGARRLDLGSRRLMNAAEATYGLNMGQNAAAYSRLVPAGTGEARNLRDLTLPGGTIDPDQVKYLLNKYPGIGNQVIVPTTEGVRLGGGVDEATARAIAKSFGGKIEERGMLDPPGGTTATDWRGGGYLDNNWQKQRAGQGYYPAIEEMGTDKFDQVAPPIAQNLRDANRWFAKEEAGGKVTLNPIMDELRAAIASDGWKGVQAMAKKYPTIPVALLATALGASSQVGSRGATTSVGAPPPAPPPSSSGPTGRRAAGTAP